MNVSVQQFFQDPNGFIVTAQKATKSDTLKHTLFLIPETDKDREVLRTIIDADLCVGYGYKPGADYEPIHAEVELTMKEEPR